MRCFFTVAFAAALAAAMNTTTWSQTGGGGGGGAGGAGGGGAGASAAGGAGTTGSTGTATNAGAASNAAGVTGTAGATGTTNGTGAAGNAGVNAGGTPAGGRGAIGPGAGTRVGGNVARSNAEGQMGGNVFLNGISPTPFFADPRVQQQLNLNPNQLRTLNTAHQNAFARFNQALNNLNNNPNLTPEQRSLQMQQLEAQFNQEFGSSLNTAFPNTQARARFDQLNRQFRGFNAFNDPAIRRELNLTPQQVSQLRALANDFRQQFQQFRRGLGNNINNLTASQQVQWNQLQNSMMTQLNTVLTPEQQQIWSQMIGQQFSFPPSAFVDGTASGQLNGSVATPTRPAGPNQFFAPGAAQGTTGQRQATQPAPQGGTVR
jgi:hypothetical protein